MLNAKKNIVVLCLLSCIFIPTKANNSLIGIGVRGGGQMLMPPAGSAEALQAGIGGMGAIDLRYTFYGCFTDRIGMGFVVGAGAGYGTSSLTGTHTDQYTNIDYLGNRIDYTIDSKYRISDKFVQANASLMLAFCFGQFTVNIGPRFMMPLTASPTLTLDEVHINAYYPQYDVHVIDQPVTGALETPYTLHNTPYTNNKYNLLLGAEIGYEWYVTDRTCLGVQLFADISVWSKYTPYTVHNTPLIAVGNISDASNPTPSVTVNAFSGPTGTRYLDFGLRAYVAFSVAKDNGPKYKYHFNSRRDTRKHRNRYLWW